MQSISTWFYRSSKGWVTLVALANFVLFLVLVLPRQADGFAANSAEAGSPDLSLIYSPADLYSMANAYGPGGRMEYIRIRFTFDLVWPLVYTFFLVTAASWIYRDVFFASSSSIRLLNLLPLAGMLLDYFENTATSLVMLRFPQSTPIVDVIAPLFTFTKWLVLATSFLLLLVGIIIALGKRLPHRK